MVLQSVFKYMDVCANCLGPQRFKRFTTKIVFMSSKIDEIDKKILEILRENANIPNAKLGKKVGLSEPAARRRVANLLAHGTIRKFTIETGEEGGVQALVFLSTATHAKFEDIARDLGKELGVGSV